MGIYDKSAPACLYLLFAYTGAVSSHGSCTVLVLSWLHYFSYLCLSVHNLTSLLFGTLEYIPHTLSPNSHLAPSIFFLSYRLWINFCFLIYAYLDVDNGHGPLCF